MLILNPQIEYDIENAPPHFYLPQIAENDEPCRITFYQCLQIILEYFAKKLYNKERMDICGNF